MARVRFESGWNLPWFTEDSNTYVQLHIDRLLCTWPGVLFLDNFDQTTGLYWNCMLLLKPPVLVRSWQMYAELSTQMSQDYNTPQWAWEHSNINIPAYGEPVARWVELLPLLSSLPNLWWAHNWWQVEFYEWRWKRFLSLSWQQLGVRENEGEWKKRVERRGEKRRDREKYDRNLKHMVHTPKVG